MDSFVRLATLADAPSINSLSFQLGYERTVCQTETALQNFIDRQDRCVFVCENPSGQVVGWIGAKTEAELTSEPYLLISGFVVDESVRGTGFGKRLLEAVYEFASNLGLSVIRLRMNEKRTETFSFYLNAGFDEVKRQVVFERSVK